MGPYDFTPLCKRTVGFDYQFDFINNSQLLAEVEHATFANGLLKIDLVRKVPDAMKPQRIEINTDGQINRKSTKPKTTMNVVGAQSYHWR